jgi:glycerol-3-phosphate acyltransferase PlsY
MEAILNLKYFYFVSIILIAYLVGSVPSGLLIAKLLKAGDIRAVGSGNIGATNAWRLGGKKLGLLTFVCDFGKAFIPTLVIRFLYGTEAAILTGIAAVLGHIFSIWLRGKGGKGISTSFGLFFGATPIIGVMAAIIWVIIFKISRVSSIASVFSVFIAFIFACIDGLSFAALSYFFLFALILFSHRDNLVRIFKKEEKKI